VTTHIDPVGTQIVAAIIGHPVSQSLSPAMHNAVFRERNANWRYEAIDVEEASLSTFLHSLKERNIGALSITMPHKEAVFAFLNESSNDVGEVEESALSARSVNTITVKSGRLIGSNTDGDGCCNALEQFGVNLKGVRVVVVGAGGTAGAVIAALGRRGATDIAIINRTETRAHEAATFSRHARVGTAADIAQANVLINATSVGMGESNSPVDSKDLHAGLVVLDAVYHPLETQLLRDAKNIGATTVDGLWMLVHQGALQQSSWLGVSGDIRIMREAAVDALAQRDK